MSSYGAGESLRPGPMWPRARRQDPAASPCRRYARGPAYLRGDTLPVAAVDLRGRSDIVAVPMLKENELIGAIVIYRTGGPAVHRQADRAGHELRRPGRHRHREHPAAQRAARDLAAAADRHRRRAQGHQPLDLRSADGARHAGRIGGPACEADMCGIWSARRARSIGLRRLRLLARASKIACSARRSGRDRGTLIGRTLAGRQDRSYPRCSGRSGIHVSARRRSSAAIAPCSVSAAARRNSDRCDRVDALRRCGRSPTSRSSWSPPSPTRR